MSRLRGFRILNMDNPIQCHIINRLNRFVLKARLQGNCYRAYLNNTGRLHQFLVKDRKGFCVHNEKQGKTHYRLFAVTDGNLGAIIDTQLQMKAFEKSAEMRLIPWLKGCRITKRNVRLGNSLIDYLLQCNEEEIYLEVKSAVLREDHYAMYPDCPSPRGRKHLRELTSHVRTGGTAIILFIAALPKVKAFKPNKLSDPQLYDLLMEANRAGVEIKAIGMVYHPIDSFIYLSNPDLDINLC